jgi:protein SCO1/2
VKKYILVSLPLIIIIIAGTFIYETNKVRSSNKETTSREIQIDERSSIGNNTKLADSCCKELTPGRYSDASIYQLESVWKNQFGKKIKLNSFLGKKVILAMFYTRCPTACLVIVNELQRLQAAIPQKYLDNYRFVLVSIDSKRDTPEILKKYADERNLNPGIWTLVTGSKYQIAELAQIIGFKYKENRSGMFTHSNLITFINQKGEIQNQSEGLNQNVNMLSSMLYK